MRIRVGIVSSVASSAGEAADIVWSHEKARHWTRPHMLDLGNFAGRAVSRLLLGLLAPEL